MSFGEESPFTESTQSTEPAERIVSSVYTRREIHEYLRAVAEQRNALQAAIAAARARVARAEEMAERIAALERKVGQWIVMAYAQAKSAESVGPEVADGLGPPGGALDPPAESPPRAVETPAALEVADDRTATKKAAGENRDWSIGPEGGGVDAFGQARVPSLNGPHKTVQVGWTWEARHG